MQTDYRLMTLEELNTHKAYLSKKMQDTLASNQRKIHQAFDPDVERLALEIKKEYDIVQEQIKLKELKV